MKRNDGKNAIRQPSRGMMAGYRTDTVSRGKSHVASGLQLSKDVERLHLIAFERLDADVV